MFAFVISLSSTFLRRIFRLAGPIGSRMHEIRRFMVLEMASTILQS
jgi:hypothetical protein